jgi:hypothetical protein
LKNHTKCIHITKTKYVKRCEVVSSSLSFSRNCPHSASQNVQSKAEIKSVFKKVAEGLVSDVGSKITKESPVSPAGK